MSTDGHGSIGVLGLGLMGRPVAVNLARAGYAVRAWNRRSVPLPEGLAPGRSGIGTFELAASVAQVGQGCEVVLSLLPDLPQLEPLLDAEPDGTPGGLLGHASRVRTLVVMSTCSPVRVRELADRLTARGVQVVDAPMSGGVSGAEAGTLSIMVGASTEAFARIEPVLRAAGTMVTRFGDVGTGSLVKACNQLAVAGTLTSLAEAVVLAERQGVNRALMLRALSGGLAASAVLEQKREALATDDYTPSGPARYLLKDLRFAQDAVADAGGGSLPLLGLLTSVFARLVDEGHGEQDSAAVLEVLRSWEP